MPHGNSIHQLPDPHDDDDASLVGPFIIFLAPFILVGAICVAIFSRLPF